MKSKLKFILVAAVCSSSYVVADGSATGTDSLLACGEDVSGVYNFKGVREGFDYYARTTNGAGEDARTIYLRFHGDSWILSFEDEGSDSIAEMKVDEVPEDKSKNFCPNIRYTWKSCAGNDRKRRSEDSEERPDITVQREF